MAAKRNDGPGVHVLPGTPSDADDAIRSTVRRAFEGSDFFRSKLAEVGLGPDSVRSVADVERLPFTTKEELRAAYPFGWTTVPMRDVLRVHASSGTTGRRTVCTYTRRDLDDWTEMFARSLSFAGITDADRVQLAVGYGLWTAGWGFQAAVERLGAMAVPAGPGNTEMQLELLVDLASTALCATASFAVNLGERVHTAGLTGALSLRIGVFGSERWSELTRSRIERLLGLEAFDLYGLTELWGPGAGIECAEHDGIHVWTDHYLLEVLDPQTLQPVPPGTQGEIAVTTYRKQATPLLRYRTRDLSWLNLAPCPCGSPYPRIGRLSGRTDDMIKLRGVQFFPVQIEHVIAGVEGSTGEYEIHLYRDASGVEEAVVKLEAPHSPGGLAADVEKRLRSEIGLRARVEIVESGVLPRSERKSQRVHDHRKL